jgi:hypothetical protein
LTRKKMVRKEGGEIRLSGEGEEGEQEDRG